MPAAFRVSDLAKIDADAHGCPACPHATVGPATSGSPDVNINGLMAVREQDTGRHAPCCGPKLWTATKGSGTVKINGKGAMRKDDPVTSCGGSGKANAGSPDVNIGG
jgi:uncharacterized Zn-binding protein involved in type VI secretion